MKKLAIIACLILISTPAFATAFGAATAWDVRTAANSGADTNGGAFDSGVVSPGTDASQGAGTAITCTLATGSTATCSPAISATTNGPGNFINFASGSGCSVQTVEILSQAAGVATFNVSEGTATDVCVGVLGGSLLTPAKAASLIVAGNSVYIQTGTYVFTSRLNIGAVSSWIGYGATHNDNGTKPLLTTSTNGFALVASNSSTTFRNLAMTTTASSPYYGLEPSNTTSFIVDGCYFSGFSKAITGDNQGETYTFYTLVVRNTEITNSSTWAIGGQGNFVIIDSYIHGNNSGSSPVVLDSVLSVGAFFMAGSIISDNTGIGIQVNVGGGYGATFRGNSIVRNSGNNVYINGALPALVMENNIIYGSTGGYGVGVSTPLALVSLNYNAFGANNSGDTQTITTGYNPITLTASPFVSSTNFALNSTAGGGALLKAAGFPGVFPGGLTTGYLDVGAAQSQAAAGGGGPYGYVQ